MPTHNSKAHTNVLHIGMVCFNIYAFGKNVLLLYIQQNCEILFIVDALRMYLFYFSIHFSVWFHRFCDIKCLKIDMKLSDGLLIKCFICKANEMNSLALLTLNQVHSNELNLFCQLNSCHKMTHVNLLSIIQTIGSVR